MDYKTCPEFNQFLRYLLIKSAPVLLSNKPGVLLRLTNCGMVAGGRKYDLFCRHRRKIPGLLGLECAVLRNNGRESLCLFFDRRKVVDRLEQHETGNFFRALGYCPSTAGTIFRELLRRCRMQDSFPHEIGILLGYPLKDVAGFMRDASSCSVVPCGLWRICGDVAASRAELDTFRMAEELMHHTLKPHQALDAVLTAVERLKRAV